MYTVTKLQKELEKAKETLRVVEDSIHKVDGKPSGNGVSRFFKQEIRHDRNSFGSHPWDLDFEKAKQQRSAFTLDDRIISRKRVFDIVPDEENEEDVSPVRKKAFSSVVSKISLPDLNVTLKRGRERRERLHDDAKAGPRSIFARLSGPPKPQLEDNDEDHMILKRQPVIPSRVTAIEHPTPSREQVIASQTKSEAMKQRDRRMFGALVGTLQQFRREETQVKEKEERRQEIERKLEEEAQREKEKVVEEKKQLLTERRRRESDIKRIEWSLNRVKEYERWEASVTPLQHFIRSKCEPHIYYLPKIITPVTEKLILETKRIVQEMIDKRFASLNEEIEKSERNAKRLSGEMMEVADDVEEEEEGVDKENVDVSHISKQDLDENLPGKVELEDELVKVENVWQEDILENDDLETEAPANKDVTSDQQLQIPVKLSELQTNVNDSESLNKLSDENRTVDIFDNAVEESSSPSQTRISPTLDEANSLQNRNPVLDDDNDDDVDDNGNRSKSPQQENNVLEKVKDSDLQTRSRSPSSSSSHVAPPVASELVEDCVKESSKIVSPDRSNNPNSKVENGSKTRSRSRSLIRKQSRSKSKSMSPSNKKSTMRSLSRSTSRRRDIPRRSRSNSSHRGRRKSMSRSSSRRRDKVTRRPRSRSTSKRGSPTKNRRRSTPRKDDKKSRRSLDKQSMDKSSRRSRSRSFSKQDRRPRSSSSSRRRGKSSANRTLRRSRSISRRGGRLRRSRSRSSPRRSIGRRSRSPRKWKSPGRRKVDSRRRSRSRSAFRRRRSNSRRRSPARRSSRSPKRKYSPKGRRGRSSSSSSSSSNSNSK